VLAGVSKTFIGTRALDDLTLSIDPAEIHALVGQNGSGKSTLIKILAGYHAPDAGTLEIEGRPQRLPLTPQTSSDLGLRFVHQNLGLIPSTSVLEAVRAGTWTHRLAPIPWKRERLQVAALLRRLSSDISPDDRIGKLTPSQRAIVAIVRALQDLPGGNAILVLDEPTASLNRVDAERLFSAVRSLRDDGHSILFVSHRIDEVLSLCDRVTVIRDGRGVLTAPASELSEESLVHAIIGRNINNLYPVRSEPTGTAAFTLSGISGAGIREFGLSVGHGEIVGITGLAGMGQDDLPYLAFGSLRRRSGTVSVGNHVVLRETPDGSVAAGISLVPADRDLAGSVRTATVGENVTMGTMKRFFRKGIMREKLETSYVQNLLHEFDVYPPRPAFTFGALSGGNQQKVLLAKWLQTAPKVVLLHEPTQGVDVGSRKQIFEIIKRTADEGTAVVIFSVEYGDLAHLCNRVLVLRDGEVSVALVGEDLDEGQVLQACLKGDSA
jgi:ribose transport system ATP-binding protein